MAHDNRRPRQHSAHIKSKRNKRSSNTAHAAFEVRSFPLPQASANASTRTRSCGRMVCDASAMHGEARVSPDRIAPTTSSPGTMTARIPAVASRHSPGSRSMGRSRTAFGSAARWVRGLVPPRDVRVGDFVAVARGRADLSSVKPLDEAPPRQPSPTVLGPAFRVPPAQCGTWASAISGERPISSARRRRFRELSCAWNAQVIQAFLRGTREPATSGSDTQEFEPDGGRADSAALARARCSAGSPERLATRTDPSHHAP